MKRALIFSFVYYPRFIGGAEVAVKEITDRISPEDMEFDLIALRIDRTLPTTEKIGNVTVHRVGFAGDTAASADSLPLRLHINKYLYPFIAAWKGARLHAKNRYSLVWAIMANYSGFGALFFKLFHVDVPFVLTLQEGDPIEYIENESLRVVLGPVKIPVRSFMYPIFKLIFTQADRIQTISNYLADFGRRMGAACPIEVVPNGVDVAHFSRTFPPAELDALERSLGKKEGDVFLITTSRLVVKNAVGDIVKSLAYLPENVKLLVLGTGYQLEELRKTAKDLKVESRVQFLGFVSHADMPKYLKVSDIFIRPSLSEGFGNSFIEAMAAGLPVIATPVGGIVDFLKDGETGLFCGVSSPEDIARKVKTYTDDPALRSRIVGNALNMVREKYDWKLVALEMKERVFDEAGK